MGKSRLKRHGRTPPTFQQNSEVMRLANPKDSVKNLIDAINTPGTPANLQFLNLLNARVTFTKIVELLIIQNYLEQVKVEQKARDAIFKAVLARGLAEEAKIRNDDEVLRTIEAKRYAETNQKDPQVLHDLFEKNKLEIMLLTNDIQVLDQKITDLETAHEAIIENWREVVHEENVAVVEALENAGVSYMEINQETGELQPVAAEKMQEMVADTALDPEKVVQLAKFIMQGGMKIQEDATINNSNNTHPAPAIATSAKEKTLENTEEQVKITTITPQQIFQRALLNGAIRKAGKLGGDEPKNVLKVVKANDQPLSIENEIHKLTEGKQIGFIKESVQNSEQREEAENERIKKVGMLVIKQSEQKTIEAIIHPTSLADGKLVKELASEMAPRPRK